VPHITTRRDDRIKYRNESATLLALMHDVENVARVTPEAVESRDDQLVTLSEEFDDGRQLASPLTACAGNLLRPYNLTPLSLEALFLYLKILINRADPGITDFRHV
jgi:hypothetical protein